MARALAAGLAADALTVIVNVGDDDVIHGAHVAADLDTVMYTLAGVEGPRGWGRAGDSWRVMDEMARLGADASFRLGDLDLATCLQRTAMLRAGVPLSAVTARLCAAHGVGPTVIPASDDPIPTRLQIRDGSWLDFQEYFVRRGHRDAVRRVVFEGAERARPAPGVIEALESADVVVIAPSNPPLSIWPILAVPGIRDALGAATRVVAVSPFFGGRTIKGPAAEVMVAVGLAGGNLGILEAYQGLVTDLVIDHGDAAEAATLGWSGIRIISLDTRMADPDDGAAFGRALLARLTPEPPVR
jgi:LPPG:FO 2-phospho-L-lactate transferase